MICYVARAFAAISGLCVSLNICIDDLVIQMLSSGTFKDYNNRLCMLIREAVTEGY